MPKSSLVHKPACKLQTSYEGCSIKTKTKIPKNISIENYIFKVLLWTQYTYPSALLIVETRDLSLSSATRWIYPVVAFMISCLLTKWRSLTSFFKLGKRQKSHRAMLGCRASAEQAGSSCCTSVHSYLINLKYAPHVYLDIHFRLMWCLNATSITTLGRNFCLSLYWTPLVLTVFVLVLQ